MSGRVTARREGRCTPIVLDRPRAKNALTAAMLSQLGDVVSASAADGDVDVVVISAEGTDFCTGSDLGDIKEVLGRDPAGRAAAFEHGMRTTIQPLMRLLLDLPQLLVVSARGHAVGLGAALVLAADLTVLSETALLSLPQAKLGHTVDHGESWLLPRKVGLGRAMQLALTGEPVSAADADRFGLVNNLVADERLDETTDALVSALLGIPSGSLRGTKRLLSRSPDQGREAQFADEVRTAAACAASPDFVTAIEGQLHWHRSDASR